MMPSFLPAASPRLRAVLACGLVAALTGLSGCGGDTAPFSPLSLTIAHINDHHSTLEPFPDQQLTIDGVATRMELGGMARMAQAFKGYAGRDNVLKLHAGDAITGTSYFTFFKGEADARMMNEICFDAMALGNHEFDEGDAGLKTFLDYLRAGSCGTAVLSANVVPAPGTPLAAGGATPYVRPFIVRRVRGIDVAIVGVTVRQKTVDSSRPLSTTRFDDEVDAVQRTIDGLVAQGIRHIVVLSHQGYAADRAMAARLTEVDAIIGGDSHSLLGDFASLGRTAEGAYPTLATNRGGSTVCIGQAWEYAKAIGEMNIQFDGRGNVASCAGRASLLVGGTFKRAGTGGSFVAVDEPTRQAIVASLSANPAVRVLDADSAAAATLSSFASQVAAKRAQIVGTVAQPLCLARVPGEATNRSATTPGCENANLVARGSDVSQVVAEAFLAGSRRADIAIQNAGGVRIPLPARAISFDDAIQVLPFSNVLVELTMTGEQIRNMLEDALANHLDRGGSTGSHPYAAGLRWDLDMSRPRGARVTALEQRNRATGVWAPLDPARSYVVVTNDFIASGQDGYTTFGQIWTMGAYVNTYLLYSQTFIDYLSARGTVGRPARAEYSHKSVVTAAGVRLVD
jgi:5'-nucleotidase